MMRENISDTSSFIDSSSFSKSSVCEEDRKKMLQTRANLSRQLESIEDSLIQWYAGAGSNELVVNECLVPYDLIKQRQETEKESKKEVQQQMVLGEKIIELDRSIEQLRAELAAAAVAPQTVEKLKSEKLQKQSKNLEANIANLGQLENNSQIEINTEKLEQQIERKKKSQETMVALLFKKMKQEKQAAERHRALRRQLEKKIEEEKKLGPAGQAERRAEKDKKLVADRVKQLENDIAILRKAVGAERYD